MKNQKHTNALIKEKSPYLLQHAHNPVNWVAWKNETLKQAEQDNKLILVSIGYSACHWCHVMEHESFEDEEVAAIMNESFICVKIDREERPDIDAVYMSAVQLMTQHGGWPLNCFTLPNGKPLYGGTYFAKDNWINILKNVAKLWKENRSKAEEYANELTNGMQQVEKIELNTEIANFSLSILDTSVKNWQQNFDLEKGGNNRAPKFPMPNNYLFLLRYGHLTNNKIAKQHALTTLEQMAKGGIYDHIGGGFARYSTDAEWKVPHFEKMLYDNAQLVSLYSEAYQQSKKEIYKEVVYEVLEFIERELVSADGGIYYAIDADSEGEEGKYYVWELAELKNIINKKDFELFSEVFSVNEKGYWEHEKYILLKDKSFFQIALNYSISESELKEKIYSWKNTLLKIREKKIRPSLDNKIIASWNALLIKGNCDAYFVFGETKFLEQAKRSAQFFEQRFLKPDGSLFHCYKNEDSYINGFLEDYAFAIDAFISLFQNSGEQKWLDLAQKLTEHTFQKFYNTHSGMFYFTSSDDVDLIVRKAEITDNVIPASNSQMARNLFKLFRICGNSQYKIFAEKMLNNVKHEIGPYGSGYSNWSLLLLEIKSPMHEVSIVGKNVDEIKSAFRKHYLPNTIFVESKNYSDNLLFKNRYIENKTLIYVCKNNSCNLAIESVEEALEQIN